MGIPPPPPKAQLEQTNRTDFCTVFTFLHFLISKECKRILYQRFLDTHLSYKSP